MVCVKRLLSVKWFFISNIICLPNVIRIFSGLSLLPFEGAYIRLILYPLRCPFPFESLQELQIFTHKINPTTKLNKYYLRP